MSPTRIPIINKNTIMPKPQEEMLNKLRVALKRKISTAAAGLQGNNRSIGSKKQTGVEDVDVTQPSVVSKRLSNEIKFS